MKLCTRNRCRGLTLVETVFSMGILFVAGMAVIGAIVYTRQMMEINKQTLTAMNYARQMLEAASTNSSVDKIDEMIIMRFNDPGLNVPATVALEYFPVTPTGQVNWTSSTTHAISGEPMYCRATVRWSSMGGTGRERSVSMSTIVRAGTL